MQVSSASSNSLSPVLLSHYPNWIPSWFRLFPFRSPLLGKSLLLSFPRATKMFQFARFAHLHLWIQCSVSRLPYSDTSGSLLASRSPELFVGRHVLLRLCVPRFPPSALSILTNSLFESLFVSELLNTKIFRVFSSRFGFHF